MGRISSRSKKEIVYRHSIFQKIQLTPLNIHEIIIPLHASTKGRNAKIESTRTGSSGSFKPETMQCNALRKLFWSEKLVYAY